MKLSGNGNLHAMKLDLSSQKDIRRFFSEVEGKFAKIHFLVNNAGMVTASDDGKKRTNTEDGFEATMATNYLGTFALTELLLEKVMSRQVLGILLLGLVCCCLAGAGKISPKHVHFCTGLHDKAIPRF